MDVARHDANLCLARLDDAGTVGANDPALGLLIKVPLDLHHVMLGNALGDRDNEGDLSLNCLNDGSTAERRRDVDSRGVSTRRVLSLGSSRIMINPLRTFVNGGARSPPSQC